MIILVRHAQSEGNKNRDIHQTTPDHRVKLTPEGHRQAQEAGRRLRELLRPDDTLHFFTSPYRRTRETTEGMLESLTSDTPSPSPFPRHTIKVYEEPRLREQDFGNFQPCSTEMERMWMERADYGHFFYRIPNGESAADAYDRVSGFNESLWRLFGEQDFASVCILVTHGLMARVFMMKWYHWSVEYFEDLRNINHCEFVIMTHNPDNGKYTLQNKLRTWSDLRKEREDERNRERVAKGLNPAPITPTDHAPIRRKWGGCPDGCTHGLSADAKRTLRTKLIDSMRHESGLPRNRIGDDHLHQHISTLPEQPSPLKHASKPSDSLDAVSIPPAYYAPRDTTSSESSTHLTREDESAANYSKTRESSSAVRPNDLSHPKRPNLQGLHRDSEDHLLHPPASAASSSTACLKLALLHLGGRDGGGSMSGANSLAPSDDEGDDHDHNHPHPHKHQGHRSNASSSHLAPPSQDLADDGDDELSANPAEELKRTRPHHHHHHHHHIRPLHSHPHNHNHSHSLSQNHHHTPQTHHHRHTSTSQPQYRMANILGDGDDLSTRSDMQTPELPSSQNGNGTYEDKPPSLEEQQREDQSIQGSVY